jgi:tagatose 6-phosphate kinase
MTFLTITFNPARDVTYLLPRLEPGAVNRVTRQYAAPGGKGNNVARILAAEGNQVRATGFLAGETGRFVESGLTAAGVECAFHWLASGETRSCHTLIDESAGTITEVLEAGPGVTGIDTAAFLASLPARLTGVDAVAICGNVPAGAGIEALRGTMTIAQECGCLLAVDSSGEALREAATFGVDLLAPNVAELNELLDWDGELSALPHVARDRLVTSQRPAASQILLSAGHHGAWLIGRAAIWHAAAPTVAVINAVGAGDALLAGFLSARAEGAPDERALARGVAFGAAAVQQLTAGVIDRAVAYSLESTIAISRIA